MSMFWGMSAARSAAASQTAATRASSDARQAQTEVQELEARLDRVMLASEAMWTLLREKMGVTDEELLNRINDIDLSDGKLDGKVRKTAVSCPKCSRTISRRFPQCMYCGQPIMHDPFS